MMEVAILAGLTLGAWLAHIGLVTVYNRAFQSLKDLPFRLAHTLETIVTAVSLTAIYRSISDTEMSAVAALITVLSSLIILDGLMLVTFKSLRSKLDIWHFALAYTAVVISILAVYSR